MYHNLAFTVIKVILSINNVLKYTQANQGQVPIMRSNFLICKIECSDYRISKVASNFKDCKFYFQKWK